jgi:tRNA pseudouridine55 synthase
MAMEAEGGRASGRERHVEGVILLDKPPGMSSNAALQAVRRLFGGIKAGHTGTLDPLATGLLPICLGTATKFAGGLLNTDKTYQALIGLGMATTTGDAEGEPVFHGSIEGCLERVRETLSAFTGEIDQLPPMFSAVKHRGRALYSYARAGQAVERQPRPVTVYALELLSAADNAIVVRVHCSKGTYIRTLAHDIGQQLGCGAHVQALRRIAIGELKIDQALGLDTLAALPEPDREKCLLSSDVLLAGLPAVVLDRARADAMLQGRAVASAELQPAGPVRLYGEDGLFLGLGTRGEHGLLCPKRMRARPTGSPAPAGELT